MLDLNFDSQKMHYDEMLRIFCLCNLGGLRLRSIGLNQAARTNRYPGLAGFLCAIMYDLVVVILELCYSVLMLT